MIITNYKKFFESKQEDTFQNVKNIVFSSLDDLNLIQIDDLNDPWGPCQLIEDVYNKKYLLQNNLNGVYAINPPKNLNIIKISIRFDKSYLSIKGEEIAECIEELESRLKGEGYDFELRPYDDIYRYFIYIGKWHHYKDEDGVSHSEFISESKQDDSLNIGNLEMCFDGLLDFNLSVVGHSAIHHIGANKGRKWVKVVIYRPGKNKYNYIFIEESRIMYKSFQMNSDILSEIVSSINKSNEFGFPKMEKLEIIYLKGSECLNYKNDELDEIKPSGIIETIEILYYIGDVSISESVRKSGDGSYSNFEGKDNQIMDFFHDLSDEFGLIYYPIPVYMTPTTNDYWEAQSANGGWYLSPNTNKINIKIVFKSSYIKENIREFVYYMDELRDRLKDFSWDSIVDNRSFGAKSAYRIRHSIEEITINDGFNPNDEDILFLEKNKDRIPRVFRIDCLVKTVTLEEIK